MLWHRAVNDEDKKRLFCLVNADKLPFQVSEEVINNLELITQGSQGNSCKLAMKNIELLLLRF